MIGWVVAALRDLVLVPQATVATEERRAVLDPDAAPLDAAATSLEIVGETTTVAEVEIGGRSLLLRHAVTWELRVEHGDAAEAIRLRDAITLDLTLRLVDAYPDLAALTDAPSGQYVSGALLWSISYGDPGDDTPNAYATTTFTLDAVLDR